VINLNGNSSYIGFKHKPEGSWFNADRPYYVCKYKSTEPYCLTKAYTLEKDQRSDLMKINISTKCMPYEVSEVEETLFFKVFHPELKRPSIGRIYKDQVTYSITPDVNKKGALKRLKKNGWYYILQNKRWLAKDISETERFKRYLKYLGFKV